MSGARDQYRHVLVGALPHHVGTVLYTGILIGVRMIVMLADGDTPVHSRAYRDAGRKSERKLPAVYLLVHIKEAVIRPPLTVLDTGALGGAYRAVALLYQRVDILETTVGAQIARTICPIARRSART